jgi:uncharacterized protein with HEPN domain
MSRDDAYVLDILKTAQDVVRLSAGMSFETFRADELAQQGMMRLVQTIGEAARCVSSEFKDLHPEVPWGDLVGWRNRLVHEYFRVRLRAVWRAVTVEVPSLVPLIEPLAPPRDKGSR